MTRRLRWRDAALAVGLLLAFFGDVVRGRDFYWGADLSRLMYPLMHLAGSCLRRLDFAPLVWSPQVMAGYPLLSEDQAGIYYPPNWILLLLLPARAAMSAALVLSYLFTALTMFWFARNLGLERASAFVAALAFAFGGFTAAHVIHLNVVAAVPWLPLVLGLLERGCRRRDLRFALLAGLAWGVQWLTGHPQVPMMTGLMAVAYLGCRLPSLAASRREAARAMAGALGLFGTAGLGLAAVHLLPLLQLSQLSVREGGALSYQSALAFSLAVASFWTGILPFLFGVSNAYVGPANFAEATFYTGAPTLLLAVATPVVGRLSPMLRFWWAVAAGALLIALGGATPAYRVIHALPGFSGLRAPARFVLLLDLALAVLAGLGMDALARTGKVTRWARVVLAVIGLGGTLAALAWSRGLLPAPMPRAGVQLAWVAGAAFGLSALWAASAGLLPRARWCGVGCALLLADLWFFFTTAHAPYRVGPARARFVDPGLDFVSRQPGLHRVFPREEGKVNRVESNQALLFDVDVIDGYASLPLQRQHRLVASLSNSRPTPSVLLGALNVRYLSSTETERPFRPTHSHLGVFFEDDVHLALLGPGEAAVAAYALGDRPVSELRLIYGTEGVPVTPDGVEVASLTLESPGAGRRVFAIHAGVDAVVERESGRRFPVQPVRAWPSRKDSGLDSFFARLPVEPALTARRLVLRYAASQGRFRLRGLTLLPAANREKVLTPVMEEGLRAVHQDDGTVVYENPWTLERAYAVHSTHRVGDGDAAGQALLAGAVRHGQAVILEDPGAPEPAGRGPSRVTVEHYSPTRVDLRADMGGDGYVVLSDAHYPGWRALVDGRPAPIYVANSLFRAVHVSDGTHQVSFRFRPWVLCVGLAITAATLLTAPIVLRRLPRPRDPS